MKTMIRLFLASAVVCAFAADSVAQTYNSEAQPGSRLGFGSAVAMSADEIAVTEPTNDYSSGFVYIYRKDRGNWERVLRLQAPDAERADRFGASLTMSGNSLVVGATSQNDGQGAVYVFEKDPSGEWAASARVTAQEPTRELGRAVAVQGKWLIAGSSGDNDMAGTAYLFKRTEDGSWAQRAALNADSSKSMTGYASNVSLANGVALVSAPMEDKGGVVYTFRYDESTMTWMEDEPLVGSESSERDQFGMRIAVEGNEMLISAPGAGGRAGIVYLYTYDESSERWIESRILRPFDAPRFAGFGTALAFNEGDVWIGAPYANRFEGTIYSYDRDGDSWKGVSKVSLEGLSRGAMFGASISAVGETAVVGLTGSDFGAGSAVILQHSDAGWVSASRLEGDPTGLETVSGGRVSCDGGEANIFKCDRVDLISFLPVAEIGGGRGVRVNDMWGWEDKLTGREYALVGRVDGTSFVDVTDPSQPIYLGNLDRSEGAPPSIWRDIKVYKDHAYIVADGAEQHGMQVFDLTQLRDVQNAPVDFKVTTHYDKIASAHNVVINEDTGFAFAVGNSAGGETCGGGLHMIDIREPANPQFAGCFADPTTGRRNTGYSHDAQCIVYNGPDADYAGREICFGSNETALSISDVTDKDTPVAVSSASYPNVAYSHQGWVTEDHRYFMMNDEGDEPSGLVEGTRTLIWDVQDLDDPQLLAEYIADNKATDHNLYIKGNLMYQSNYDSGLRILDISDVANPVEVGFFDTVPFGKDGAGMNGSWSNYPYFKNGVIAVTSGNEGLFLLQRKDEGI
ncbi:MAG: choice-of-anchor B family protein [Rhodothermales bacterium]|nr:choice-of-anchor B family protein [Rhodothermales bacterium]